MRIKDRFINIASAITLGVPVMLTGLYISVLAGVTLLALEVIILLIVSLTLSTSRTTE